MNPHQCSARYSLMACGQSHCIVKSANLCIVGNPETGIGLGASFRVARHPPTLLIGPLTLCRLQNQIS